MTFLDLIYNYESRKGIKSMPPPKSHIALFSDQNLKLSGSIQFDISVRAFKFSNMSVAFHN